MDSNFYSTIIDRPNLSSTSTQVTGLQYVTKYYWHVNAANSDLAGTWSPRYSFITTPGIALGVQASNSGGGGCSTKTSDCSPKLTWTLYGASGTVTIYRNTYAYGQGSCGPLGSAVQSQTSPNWWVDAGVILVRPGQTPYTTDCYHVTCQSYTSNGVAINSNQISSTVSKGSEEARDIPPPSTILEGNFPNPFNPATEIRYGLSEDTHVRLTVYNVLGQVVGTIVDEAQTAGEKIASFDAGNLTSGVYFYRLQAGKFSTVKKMLLLK